MKSRTSQNENVYLHWDDNKCTRLEQSSLVNIFIDSEDSPPHTFSNRVKCDLLVNYDFDVKYSYGNIVSSNDKFIAYGLKGVALSPLVRIFSQKSQVRGLIKGIFTSHIHDIAFMSLSSDYLAIIESNGILHIFNIVVNGEVISNNPIVRINCSSNSNEIYPRIFWCPPSSEDEEDSVLFIAASIGCSLYVIDVGDIIDTYDEEHRQLEIADLKEYSVQLIDCHSDHIVCCIISPDSKVVVTAGKDGHAKFWPISMGEACEQPLHEWVPHDGSPVIFMAFCDDFLLIDESSVYWRFLITISDNGEVKLWCAQTWKCLHTLKFKSDLDNYHLKACLDSSGKYLVISDIDRKFLYVISIYVNLDENVAYFKSIDNYFFQQPILSFGVNRIYDSSPDDYEDDDQHDAENRYLYMFAVQSKKLQKFLVYVSNSNFSSHNSVASISDNASNVDLSTFHEPILQAASSMDNLILNTVNMDGGDHDVAPLVNFENDDAWPVTSMLNSESISSSFTAVSALQSSIDFVSSNDTAVKQPYDKNYFEINENLTPNSKEITDIMQNNHSNSSKSLLQEILPSTSMDQNVIYTEKSLKETCSCQSTNLKVLSVLEKLTNENRNLVKSFTDYQTLQDKRYNQIMNSQEALKFDLSHNERLEKLIRNEIKKQHEASIRTFDASFQKVIAEKVTVADSVMKNEIKKIVSSKSIIDALSQATITGMENCMLSSFREILESRIIPGFERACNQLFKQINQTFREGTDKYVRELEFAAKSNDSIKRDTLTTVSKEFIKSTDNSFEKLKHQLMGETKVLFDGMRTSLSTEITRELKASIQKQNQEMQQTMTHVIRSSAATPAPVAVGPSDELKQYQLLVLEAIKTKNFTKAFDHALRARSIDLIVAVCEAITLEKFMSDTTLPQTILMSLIQQISSSLDTHILLKLNFIETTLVKIDPMDKDVRKHFPMIGQQVSTNLSRFIAKNSAQTLEHSTKCKIILLSIKSLVTTVAQN